MSTTPPRIAIVGCGAVTELCHLPAFGALGWQPAALVDLDVARAQRLAETYGGRACADYHDAIGLCDAAIIALPHHLHAAAAADFLAARRHLLVEKPLALGCPACEAMVQRAAAAGVVLAVGHVRRYWHALRWVKAALDAGLLGALRSFDIRDGSADGWPAASAFFWSRATAGGGVTMDIGVHVLDLVRWWFGEVRSCTYADDDYGGVEADARLTLRLDDHLEGTVELSRLRSLRGTAVIGGELGSLEVGLAGNRLSATPTALLTHRFEGLRGDRLPAQTGTDIFAAQLVAWQAAIAGTGQIVSGADGAAVVGLVEQLYAVRQRLEPAWVRADPLAEETRP